MTISDPTMPIGTGTVAASAAPGATGPGGQTNMASALGFEIIGAMVGLFVLGYAFRKGGKALPPLRVDAMSMLNCWFSVLVVGGTVKVLCYKYNGHKWAQAYLLIGA
jgi:hypothetical protein